MTSIRRCVDRVRCWPLAYRVATSITFSACIGQITNLVGRGRWGLA